MTWGLGALWLGLGSLLFVLGFWSGLERERIRRNLEATGLRSELDYARRLIEHWKGVAEQLEGEVSRANAFRADVWKSPEEAASEGRGDNIRAELRALGRGIGELRAHLELYRLEVLERTAPLLGALRVERAELEGRPLQPLAGGSVSGTGIAGTPDVRGPAAGELPPSEVQQ